MRNFFLALPLMLSATAWGASSKETVKIAVAGPLTGGQAAFGEQLWKGATQAAADINKKGGINGMQIKIVKGDDACEPKQAVSVANQLVDSEKVHAVVGHFCSATTIAASPVYGEGGVIMITPASTNPKVTESNIPTVLRMCGRDDQQGIVAADFIINKLKAKKVALVHDTTAYGKGLADETRKQLKSAAPKEVLYEGLTRGEKDYNALVTKIKGSGADVVFFGGVHSEAGPLLRQLRDQGVSAKFVSGDGIVSKDLITAAGGPKYVEGVYMTFGRDPRTLPSGKEVVEKFRKQNYEPEGYTLYSYASVEAIAQAFEKTKSTDGMKAAQWLRNNKVDTVMGTKAWDKKGDLQESDYVIYVWDGKGNYAELQSES